MQHLLFASESLLVGDGAAETLLEYAALLVRKNSADAVKLAAINVHGDPVIAHLLLSNGANLVTETTCSTQEEPDNSDAVAYMREQMMLLSSPPQVLPDDETVPASYDDLDLDLD